MFSDCQVECGSVKVFEKEYSISRGLVILNGTEAHRHDIAGGRQTEDGDQRL